MNDTIAQPARPARDEAALPGQLLGSAIAGVFGLIYVEVNAGPLPGSWPAALRVAGALAAAGLALVIVLARRAAAGAPAAVRPGARAGFGRGYWIIVAGEAAAIWAGAAVLSGPAGLPHAVVAWVSVVVGAHFLALAALWRLRMLRYLGVAIVACGLAGLAAALASVPVAVVAATGGVLPGVLLMAAGYRGAGGAVLGHPVR